MQQQPETPPDLGEDDHDGLTFEIIEDEQTLEGKRSVAAGCTCCPT